MNEPDDALSLSEEDAAATLGHMITSGTIYLGPATAPGRRRRLAIAMAMRALEREVGEGHKMKLEFDNGGVYPKLICPNEGKNCPRPGHCIECGFEWESQEDNRPCHCNFPRDEGCVVKPWADELGIELLEGVVEVNVKKIDWSGGEEPTIRLSVPEAT